MLLVELLEPRVVSRRVIPREVVDLLHLPLFHSCTDRVSVDDIGEVLVLHVARPRDSNVEAEADRQDQEGTASRASSSLPCGRVNVVSLIGEHESPLTLPREGVANRRPSARIRLRGCSRYKSAPRELSIPHQRCRKTRTCPAPIGSMSVSSLSAVNASNFSRRPSSMVNDGQRTSTRSTILRSSAIRAKARNRTKLFPVAVAKIKRARRACREWQPFNKLILRRIIRWRASEAW